MARGEGNGGCGNGGLPRGRLEARARELAAEIHAGQVDQDGSTAHLDHCAEVVALLSGERERAVGWLHDAIEDGDAIDEAWLCAHGIPAEQAATIAALSRRPDESYWQYLDRVCASDDPLLLRVKLADNQVNLDRSRRTGHSLARRYERARKLLLAAATLSEK